jgi:hypothetical protein
MQERKVTKHNKCNFNVNDYVIIIDDDYLACNTGIIFRVSATNHNRCTVIPAFGFFESHLKKGVKYVNEDALRKVSIVHLGLEYNKLVNFINQVKKEYSTESPSDPQTNSAKLDDGDNV